MILEAGALFKTLFSYLVIPFTFIVGLLGFQFKRMITRIDRLETELDVVHRQLDVVDAKADLYKDRLDKIDAKLENIIIYLRDK